ncbi:MAG: sporulation protein YqfD [Clostridia bacterium]|nr:sporulation protein YqfD [Clostridia bacterium]
MIKRALDFIIGTTLLEFDEDISHSVLDAIISGNIPYDAYITERGRIIKVRTPYVRVIKEALPEGIAEVGEYGLPVLIKRYSRRYGAIAGAAVFALIVFFSSRVVWRIDVAGNDTIPSHDIVDRLDDLGFTYGTNYKDVDFDVLRNDYLRKYDDLAWISVNMKGTWAEVEVKELLMPDERSTEGAVNVVASEAGKITMIEAYEGKPVVRIGDCVGKGDLLLSGVIDVAGDRVRFEGSDGAVYAEVTREFSVKIPKRYEVKEYSGKEYGETELIFFKKSVKLSGNYRISPLEYDTIEIKDRVYLSDGFPLPLFINKTVYKEYVTRVRTLSEDEILSETEKRAYDALTKTLDGADLLSVSYTEEDSPDQIVRNYTVRCIADIAEKKIIPVN